MQQQQQLQLLLAVLLLLLLPALLLLLPTLLLLGRRRRLLPLGPLQRQAPRLLPSPQQLPQQQQQQQQPQQQQPQQLLLGLLGALARQQPLAPSTLAATLLARALWSLAPLSLQCLGSLQQPTPWPEPPLLLPPALQQQRQPALL